VKSPPPSRGHPRLRRIVAGGQTGADRAALDWAIASGIPHGGWCPRGRRAEDGPIDQRYHLHESQGTQYRQRTEWNVRDSDGTVIFSLTPHLRGGCKATAESARKHRKPWLHLTRTVPVEVAVSRLGDWLHEHGIQVLNVAGSRASQEPEVGDFVREVLSAVWDRWAEYSVATVDHVG
jgi:hypothetical protein